MSPPRHRGAAALLAGLAAYAAVSAWAVHRLALTPGLAAPLCFGAVVAAAMIISWGAEAAQFYVSQGLAVAIIALLQVVPEFMVEAVIAWEAGKSGRVELVFANATGSNRLLTGFGRPLIFLVTDIFHRLKRGGPLRALVLREEHVVELLALLGASSWYLVVLATGTLSLLDTLVLGGAFVAYLWTLNRLPAEDEEEQEELLAPARLLVGLQPRTVRRLVLGGLFVLGGVVMWAVAEPFLHAMEVVALSLGVTQFAFVQWVAPFLTEFPEKVTAVYWSRTVKLAPMALLNMVSSTVNQYTALVAMIPLAFAASAGHARPIPMDPLHRVELFLSFATTLYGVACLAKFRFTRANANWMIVLFLVQFAYSGPLDPRWVGLSLPPVPCHLVIACSYVLLAAVEVVRHRREIHLVGAVRHTLVALRR